VEPSTGFSGVSIKSVALHCILFCQDNCYLFLYQYNTYTSGLTLQMQCRAGVARSVLELLGLRMISFELGFGFALLILLHFNRICLALILSSIKLQ
jgi:hypothetical protein